MVETAEGRRCSVTVNGMTLHALAAEVDLRTPRDESGMPMIGSLMTEIRVWVDLHDRRSLPFETYQRLFELANIANRDKIVDMKVQFWRDEAQTDALCSINFMGWISRFLTASPWAASRTGVPVEACANHILYIELEPALEESQYKVLRTTN